MKDKALTLNKDQKLAFARLKRAFMACEKAGIHIHGELTTLHAINSLELDGRNVEYGCSVGSAEISEDSESFRPACFYGCAADDGLSFSN